jgi:hypothetical protein
VFLIATGNVPLRTPEALFGITDDQARRTGSVERAGRWLALAACEADPGAGVYPIVTTGGWLANNAGAVPQRARESVRSLTTASSHRPFLSRDPIGAERKRRFLRDPGGV